jgi:hypothetical protein
MPNFKSSSSHQEKVVAHIRRGLTINDTGHTFECRLAQKCSA